MPTYSYRCPSCGHEYEKFQKISDDTRVKCPKCGKRGERLISGGAGLVFKGSGFYITDYKKADQKGSSEKEKSSDTGDSKSKSSDKKPKSKSGDDS